MTDRRIQQLQDCYARLEETDKEVQKLWFDLHAHLITAEQWVRAIEPINAERNNTLLEITELRTQGLEHRPIIYVNQEGQEVGRASMYLSNQPVTDEHWEAVVQMRKWLKLPEKR